MAGRVPQRPLGARLGAAPVRQPRPPVEAGPLAERQAVEDRPAHERVREREPAPADVVPAQQAGADRRFEGVDHGNGREVDHAAENRYVGMVPEHGRRSQDRGTRRRQAGQPPADEVGDARRHTENTEIRGGPPALVGRDHSPVRQMADHLDDEQRVAAGQLAELPGKSSPIGIEVAARAAQQIGHLIGA